MMTKYCPRCKCNLSVSQFSKNKRRKDGLGFWCKECHYVYRHEQSELKPPKYNNKYVGFIPIEGEIWKDIQDYEGKYAISSLGRLLSKQRQVPSTFYGRHFFKTVVEKIRIAAPTTDGYLALTLSNNKNNKSIRIHQLVATHFIPNPNNLPQINHIDGNKLNNTIENLEWVTQSENIKHAWATGLIKTTKGEKSHASKLKNKDVYEIRELIKANISSRKIAMIYCVSKGTIMGIKNGSSWAHLL